MTFFILKFNFENQPFQGPTLFRFGLKIACVFFFRPRTTFLPDILQYSSVPPFPREFWTKLVPSLMSIGGGHVFDISFYFSLELEEKKNRERVFIIFKIIIKAGNFHRIKILFFYRCAKICKIFWQFSNYLWIISRFLFLFYVDKIGSVERNYLEFLHEFLHKLYSKRKKQMIVIEYKVK